MKINLKKLIPKEWIIENINKDKIKVYYINKGRGNSPKPFILPRIINVDKEFIEAIAIYLGDGKLSNDKYHLDFETKDKDIIRFMLRFFINKLNIKINDFRYRLTYKIYFKNSIEEWTNYIGIPKYPVNLKQSNRHKDECFGMQISSLILRYLFEQIKNKILESNFYENPILRRAFLRGLFAAEGGIGISRKENYIVYMAYHLSYEKEEQLALFIQKLLRLEGIESKHKIRKEKGERYIQITNWTNYHKSWKIDLFDLCQRKKKKFLDKVRKTNFFFKIKSPMIKELLNSSGRSHRQTALRLGIQPTTLCLLNKGKTKYINIKDLISLAKFNNISIKEIKKNIITTRVNRTTHIADLEFVNFILDSFY